MHIKCTYNGVQLSETEFPKNWLTEGIQIKILFPFRLKPWHKSRIHPSHQDQIKKKEQNKKQKDSFCFLIVLGMETELPFGPPLKKRPSFFKPIFKELQKKIKEFRNQPLKSLKEKFKLFLRVPNEITKWIIQSLPFFKIIKKIFRIGNPIRVFGLTKESHEIKKKKKIQ